MRRKLVVVKAVPCADLVGDNGFEPDAVARMRVQRDGFDGKAQLSALVSPAAFLQSDLRMKRTKRS